jgi:dienelactone hydrolase
MTANRPAGLGLRPLLALFTLLLAAGANAREDAPPPYPDHTRILVVRDAAGVERPVATPADWAIRRDHILRHFQEVAGPLPPESRRVPLDVKVVAEIDEPSYVRRKITYQSEAGDRVPAWLLLPKGEAPGPRPAALALHPTAAIGKDIVIGAGERPNRAYARELAERGFIVIAPDYPTMGEREVDAYAMGYASTTMKAIWDHRRALDVLEATPGVDRDRIAAIGHSLGGHNAIFVGLFDPRVRTVVSSCGFNAFPHYYGGNLAGWSHRGYMPRIAEVYGKDPKRMPFDFPELVAALAPRAFFANAPRHDANFEVEGVRVCLDAARPVYRLLGAENRLEAVFPEAEHDFPDASRRAAYAFLDRELARPR